MVVDVWGLHTKMVKNNAVEMNDEGCFRKDVSADASDLRVSNKRLACYFSRQF